MVMGELELANCGGYSRPYQQLIATSSDEQASNSLLSSHSFYTSLINSNPFNIYQSYMRSVLNEDAASKQFTIDDLLRPLANNTISNSNSNSNSTSRMETANSGCRTPTSEHFNFRSMQHFDDGQLSAESHVTSTTNSLKRRQHSPSALDEARDGNEKDENDQDESKEKKDSTFLI
jgi:hypothetical protein